MQLQQSQSHDMNSIIDIHTTHFYRIRIHKKRTAWTSLNTHQNAKLKSLTKCNHAFGLKKIHMQFIYLR